MHRRKIIVLLCLASFFGFYVFLQSCGSEQDFAAGSNAFVGDARCQSCHIKEFAEWKTSDHYKAMLPATDSTVLADFNNVSFTAEGVTSRFFKNGSKFIINTQGPDGVNYDYEVLFTFGHYPLQQFLVAFPGGRMQVPRVSWDSRERKWFNQYKGQTIHSADWLHWSRPAQNWNTMCASCHSTNLQKNYNFETDSFHTTYASINVSCESCHGAGKTHVDFVNSTDYKEGKRVAGLFMVLGKSNSQTAQINACAPCHTIRSEINDPQVAPAELLDSYIPQAPATEQFHADGQVKGEVYSYTSFLQSKMHTFGVKCSNCHNAHTGKILFSGNKLCMQCHSKTYDTPSHHFHGQNTAGAECKSCHMQSETFMGVDLRHDHSFRVPRPDLSAEYGTPNACTKCHTGKSDKWAAAAVERWYGPNRKYHFADDLLPGSLLNEKSEAHLIKLLNDTATPAIIKTAAATYLGSISTTGSATALLSLLSNKDGQVRYGALRSLSNFAADTWLQTAAPLLADKIRAVRIAAADLFLTVPPDQVPDPYRQSLNTARAELERYLHYQTDFADGNVLVADHYLRLKDYEKANRFYLRALRMDSLLNYARLNLSTSYNAQGKNDEALKTLQNAAAVDPKNERVFYNLGLLYHEMQKENEAVKSFEKAVLLKSKNPRLYYNYGLLLLQQKKSAAAEIVLRKGLSLSPADASVNYALAYLYLQLGQPAKARPHAALLKKVDPANPNYAAIFQATGM